MITIAEPKEPIDKLWGKQRVREDDTYRLMRYVLRVDHEDKVLLHNVVTGRLVVLDREEAEALETLPAAYSPVMEQLVTEHYLVPESYDEHQQVVNLRKILRALEDNQESADIVHYTILPTTACNARCYYCFEKGLKPATMTEQTANDVVDFISDHCGAGKTVHIIWFGGEPTVASHRISQICRGLSDRGISFHSKMISNGYLLDEEMIRLAKEEWNLENVQISVDGIEESYNRIKAYPDAKDNPYRRVIRNVGLLLNAEINVDLRMNYGTNNYQEFALLLDELYSLYKDDPFLGVRAHQLNDHGWDKALSSNYGDGEWYERMNDELNRLSQAKGLYRKPNHLLCLNYRWCSAAQKDDVTILPSGELVSCPELLDSTQVIGDLKKGITNTQLVQSWRKFADYQGCSMCKFFPSCVRVVNCKGKDKCNTKQARIRRCQQAALHQYEKAWTV